MAAGLVTRGTPDQRQPKGPAVILVRPQMGENIGMVARAMLNCGLTDLRLVAPRDGWPSDVAMATASGAGVVIENARVFETLRDAMADCRYALATGSFDRDMVKQVLSPEVAADTIIEHDKVAGAPVCALVFGPERSGLENEDVVLCDAYITVPLNPAYSSLNLAQAVLLVAYAWYRRVCALSDTPYAGQGRLDIDPIDDTMLATKEQVHGLFDHVVDTLDAAGYFKSLEQKPTMIRNLRNSFQRLRLSTQEINTFRGALKLLREK